MCAINAILNGKCKRVRQLIAISENRMAE